MSEGNAEAVEDECEALGAIYGADFEDERYLHPVTVAGTVCVRRLTVRHITLGMSFGESSSPCVLTARFLLPAAYPAHAAPVVVLEPDTTGDELPTELFTTLGTAVREACWHEGGVCCYDCVELLRAGGEGAPAAACACASLLEARAQRHRRDAPARSLQPRAAPPIVRGEALCDRKSKFVAFAAVVHSEADVAAVRDALLADRKIAAATHNMAAWRYRAPDGTLVAQRDDDGEAGAGDRMLHVLDAAGEVETLVVVTRWFGGILLGTDRFRHIVALTRTIIDSPAFTRLRTVPRETPSDGSAAFSSAKRILH